MHRKPLATTARSATSASMEEAWEIAVEAYIYPYPLAISGLRRRVSADVARRLPRAKLG